jgi:hypothetical protein
MSTRLMTVIFPAGVVPLVGLSSGSEHSRSDDDKVLKRRSRFNRGLSVARDEVVRATPISTVLQMPRSTVV